MARMQNDITKITKAKPETVSVRTTIPSHIAKKLGLKSGDSVEWDVDKGDDGTWFAKFEKVE